MKVNIKILLEKQGMSQRELAQKLKISESTISRYINNNRVPRGEHLLKLAKVLQVRPDEILELEEE